VRRVATADANIANNATPTHATLQITPAKTTLKAASCARPQMDRLPGLGGPHCDQDARGDRHHEPDGDAGANERPESAALTTNRL
jgi:hypothetical protein